jgi:hypothetical protein
VDGACTDNAGNVATDTVADINIDKTAPTVSGTPSRSPDGGGWFNHAFSVEWSGQDALSGLDACDAASQYAGPDTAADTLTGSCTDKAGNTASGTYAFKFDGTKPAITFLSVTPAANGNGWHKTDVLLTWTCADALSGPASPSVQQSISTEGANQSATASCDDMAGNSASDTHGGVNIDKTAPVLSGAASPAANLAGWNNTNVTVSFTCNDALSGVDTASGPTTLSSEGANQSVQGSCTDLAGNSSTHTVGSINIDKTAPTNVQLTVTGGILGNAGWYVSDVTVHTTGVESLSGPLTCTADQVQTSDTTGQTFHGTCTNKADLQTNAVPIVIKLDKTKPTLDPKVTPNPVILNGSGVAAAQATDGTSGIAQQSCDPVVSTSVGSKQLSCSATDVAGNSATAIAAYTVGYAPAGTACLGQLGHQVLQPINIDGTSVFKQKSTVPVKFRVCDANGASLGTAGVVKSFYLIQRIIGTVASDVNEPVDSTTPDITFRWSPIDQQWIFNVNTKSSQAGVTYVYRITLGDDTPIDFQYGLK